MFIASKLTIIMKIQLGDDVELLPLLQNGNLFWVISYKYSLIEVILI